MNCTEMNKCCQLYLDRELDAADKVVVETHLRLCSACRDVFARERALSASINQEVRHYRAPLELRDRIRRDLGTEKRSPFRNLRHLSAG
jgi:predicted anti-sigma-YlaC factor YlaD